jgi:hypothetical protein
VLTNRFKETKMNKRILEFTPVDANIEINSGQRVYIDQAWRQFTKDRSEYQLWVTEYRQKHPEKEGDDTNRFLADHPDYPKRVYIIHLISDEKG